MFDEREMEYIFAIFNGGCFITLSSWEKLSAKVCCRLSIWKKIKVFSIQWGVEVFFWVKPDCFYWPPLKDNLFVVMAFIYTRNRVFALTIELEILSYYSKSFTKLNFVTVKTCSSLILLQLHIDIKQTVPCSFKEVKLF